MTNSQYKPHWQYVYDPNFHLTLEQLNVYNSANPFVVFKTIKTVSIYMICAFCIFMDIYWKQ